MKLKKAAPPNKLNSNFMKNSNTTTLTALENKVIAHTNRRIASWYADAQIDYGVIGEGKARIEGNQFIVDYTEDGEKKTWKTAYYPEYLRNGKDYFYSCWSSLC